MSRTDKLSKVIEDPWSADRTRLGAVHIYVLMCIPIETIL